MFHTTYNPYFGENLKLFAVTDFIAELTAHIPPKGVHYIRRYGLYSSRTRSRWSRLPHPAAVPGFQDLGRRSPEARRSGSAGLPLPRLFYLGSADFKNLWRRSLRLPSLRPPDESPRRHHRSAGGRQDPAPPRQHRPPAPGAGHQRAAVDCLASAPAALLSVAAASYARTFTAPARRPPHIALRSAAAQRRPPPCVSSPSDRPRLPLRPPRLPPLTRRRNAIPQDQIRYQ